MTTTTFTTTTNHNRRGQAPPAKEDYVMKKRQTELIAADRLVDLGGLHRGGEHALDTISAWNRSSPNVVLGVNGYDVNPNRIHHAVAHAAHANLPLVARHGRLQDFMAADGPAAADRPLIVAVDDARSGAEVSAMCASFLRAMLLYLIIRLPNTQLVGLTAVLRKSDVEEKLALAAFLLAIADNTVRKGHRAVLGDEGLPEHVFLEPHYRQLFRAHLTDNLPRLLWDLEPEAAPIEVTFDGETRLPLLIEDSRAGWRDVETLARDVFGRPSVAIAPGKDLCIGEVGPDGLRLHTARYRVLDRALSVNATSVIDPAAFEEALRRAERQTISRRNPVSTTD
jgi:hypothetical protein